MAEMQVNFCMIHYYLILIENFFAQNGNQRVMQDVVRRKFRANQNEIDPQKIDKQKAEYVLILHSTVN